MKKSKQTSHFWVSRKLIAISVFICFAFLSACGFSLRGVSTLPFDSVSVEGSETSSLLIRLKRDLRNIPNLKVVNDPKQAQVRIVILYETQPPRTVIGYDNNGAENAFRLTRGARIRFTNTLGRDLANADFVQRRDLTISPNTVLAKESEESTLYLDMERDLVDQVILRLKSLSISSSPSIQRAQNDSISQTQTKISQPFSLSASASHPKISNSESTSTD